jgi:hypothetical protein
VGSPMKTVVLVFAVAAAACGGNGGNTSGAANADAGDGVTTTEAGLDATVPDAQGEASDDAGDATVAEASDGAAPSADAPSEAAYGATDASADATDASGDAADDAVTFGDPSCTPLSGTRIKVRWYVGPEGTRVFDSMYDSMLNTRCSWGTTSDGKVRCLPMGASGLIAASDPSCKNLVIQKFEDCSGSQYARADAPNGCTVQSTIYQIGDVEPYDGGTLYQSGPTGCAPSFSFQEDSYPLTGVPDSTFVEGTVSKLTIGRYAMNVVDFEDGAHYCDVIDGFFDSQLQSPTADGTATDNQERLLPYGSVSGGFSDNTCMTPAAVVYGGCGGPTSYDVLSDQCTGVATVRSIGAAIDAGGFEQIYTVDAGFACEPSQEGPLNAVSDPISPGTFGPVLTQPSGDAGRLQDLNFATVGGLRWRENAAFDTQTMQKCTVQSGPGPTASCLPTAVGASPIYSEATCTQSVLVVDLRYNCVPTGFPPAGTVAVAEQNCQAKMVHVGGRYTGPIFQKNGNVCSQVGFPDEVFFLGIDDIDGGAFETMTAIVE